MNKESYKYDRDEFYFGSVVWAIFALITLYFGWESGAIFMAGIAVLHLALGIAVHIWIKRP